MSARPTTLAPRKQPVQSRSVETRARILDAAARVFEQRGYAGTTNQIAEQAGLSVGSLYQYFPNKDSILVELIDRHLGDAAERATAAIGRFDAATTLDERVRVVVEVMVDNHLGTPRLHQVLFEEAPRPAATRAPPVTPDGPQVPPPPVRSPACAVRMVGASRRGGTRR